MFTYGDDRVSAVVLAYSREKILPDLIEALRNQSRKPDEIIVINQGSNPVIASWLARQNDLTVIVQENLGSAGGFCRGIEESIQRGHGWTWIFDDDAIPGLTALEELANCPYFKRQQTAFLGSRIIDRNGRTYMSPGGSDSTAWYGTVLEDKCVEAVDGCWLGLLVNTRAVYEAGLPVAEFFLWDEDREFISRLARHGKGYCVLTSVITHFQDDNFDAFGKDFIKIAYYARNHVARAKLVPSSFMVRILRVTREVFRLSLRVLKGEWPLRVFPWILKGAFLFSPRIRYVDQNAVSGAINAARGLMNR
ncbi:MAG: glycosyltransferase [Nitrosomonadales bacterium]|nr:glycosyltransferase [Nitrosomonadales bacterium]